ncbi:TB2/DP1, HVA22 family-domain-containing protein, partial [Phycomyces nitens]
TGIDRKYWRIGTVGLVVVLAVLHFAGSILIGLLSWVYPAYASFKALETPEKKSDKHWLIYWTVIAFVHTGLSILDHLLFWVPFYSLLKFGFFIWLTMPWFGGAKILYVQAIRPWLLWAEKDIDERAKGLRQQL